MLDPRVMCTCIDEYLLYSLVYPDWATRVHFEKAQTAGMLAGELIINPIPSCQRREIEIESCASDAYWNPLGCACWPNPALSLCSGVCDEGLYRKPTEPCACVSEEQLMQFYPEEATLEDVISWFDAWFPTDVEPEPLEEGLFLV